MKSLFFRSIGYNEVTAQSNKSSFNVFSSSAMCKDGLDDHEQSSQRLLPKPDISQMIPFKPKRDAYLGEHPVSGMYKHNLDVDMKLEKTFIVEKNFI